MEPSQSSDDIVQELRDWAYITDEVQGKAVLLMLSGVVFNDAANEIERLRAENTRLASFMHPIGKEAYRGLHL